MSFNCEPKQDYFYFMYNFLKLNEMKYSCATEGNHKGFADANKLIDETQRLYKYHLIRQKTGSTSTPSMLDIQMYQEEQQKKENGQV